MEGTTWAALTATLSVTGGIWTWFAFQRRGAASGLRALGFTLLPAAAWLTGTLGMVVEIGGAISRWAAGLVFNIFTWSGIGLAALALALILVSGFLRERQLKRALATNPSGELPTKSSKTTDLRTPVDDDLAEIEAMLKKRGIS